MTSAEISKRIDKSFSGLRLKILLLAAASIIVSGVLLYVLSGTPLASTYTETISSIDTYKDALLTNSIYIYPTMTVLLLAGVVIICIKHSHGIAGPMKRIEDTSKMLADGDYDMPFAIRSTDRIQEIAEIVNDIRTTYKNKHDRLGKELEDLHAGIIEFEKAVIACDTVEVDRNIRNLRSVSGRIESIFSELRL